MDLCYGEDYDNIINIKVVSDFSAVHLTVESERRGRAHHG